MAKTSGVDCANEQSQGGFITYDDPTGRLERERILEHLKRASPSQDIESLYYPVEKLGCVIKDKDAESLEKKENKALEEPVIDIEDDDENNNVNSAEVHAFFFNENLSGCNNMSDTSNKQKKQTNNQTGFHAEKLFMFVSLWFPFHLLIFISYCKQLT